MIFISILFSKETFKTSLKVTDAHPAALYKIKPISEHLLVSGDEDGTVKLWDKRHSKGGKAVMEDKSLDDAVTDFFHKASDPNYLIASSAEGKNGLLTISQPFVYDISAVCLYYCNLL